MTDKYKILMKKCLTLAKKGEGRVSPNPLVGCVIFDDNYEIISTGYHKKCGENHAERNAILNSDTPVKGMNLAVNLEPCSHYGKTPPCADLIIEKGIKKVIIGMKDINPVVNGNGIKKLQAAGIEVITGVLEKECRELNEVFIKNQTQNKPFTVLKTATTLDGKIAASTGNSKWITDETSRYEVQKLRNKYDAVLTTSKTVISDNPSMTCRMKNGRNPVRIIVDTNLVTDSKSKIYNNDGVKVYIISKPGINKNIKQKYPENVEIIECPLSGNHIDINIMSGLLYEKGIKSILVEAGAVFNNALIQSGIVDKFIQFIAPKILADNFGLSFVTGENRQLISECNNLIFNSVKKLKNDIMISGSFVK